MSEWNPRYEQYCRVHGFAPESCPDKSNAEFIIWSSQQLVEARKQHPEFFLGHSLSDHDGYDRWLEGRPALAAERQLGEVSAQ